MFITTPRSLVLLTGETCLLLTAVLIGTYLRLGDLAVPVLATSDGVFRVLLIVGVCQLCLHYADLYNLASIVDIRDLVVRLFLALAATSLILAVIYFVFPSWIIGRGVFFSAAVLVISLVSAWRLMFSWVTSRVAPRERLLIVGTNPAAVELARELHDRQYELGVEIVGFVDSDPARIGQRLINPGIVGTIDDIPALIPRLNADRVVLSVTDARGKLPMDRLLEIRLQTGVTFDHLVSVYEEYTGKIAIENLRPSWFVFSSGFSKKRPLLVAKRVADVVLSIVGLIVTAPLMVIVAAAIKLTSAGGILYHQERVGLNGRVFTVYKLRTMRADAELTSGPTWSVPNDGRVTWLGRILRKTRFDELPQLWNVLRGDMSFVGPRPERPTFVEQLTEKIPFYFQRHVLKPGVTGWAQVHYSYGASVEDALEKLQYDLYYIKNLSIRLDLMIIFETIKTVVLRRGAR